MFLVLERIPNGTDYQKASVRNGWCFLLPSIPEGRSGGGFLWQQVLPLCRVFVDFYLDSRPISRYNNAVINNTVIDNGIMYERRTGIWQ